jgi:hypothetical protein
MNLSRPGGRHNAEPGTFHAILGQDNLAEILQIHEFRIGSLDMENDQKKKNLTSRLRDDLQLNAAGEDDPLHDAKPALERALKTPIAEVNLANRFQTKRQNHWRGIRSCFVCRNHFTRR